MTCTDVDNEQEDKKKILLEMKHPIARKLVFRSNRKGLFASRIFSADRWIGVIRALEEREKDADHTQLRWLANMTEDMEIKHLGRRWLATETGRI